MIRHIVNFTIEDIGPSREYPYFICTATYDNGEQVKTSHPIEMQQLYEQHCQSIQLEYVQL